jgi:hypothetical protein
MLFILCTVHVGTSLQQLLDAFVYTPDDVLDYSTIYWLDYTTTLPVLKAVLYDTLVRNPCTLVYHSYAQQNNKGACPRIHASKFNMATVMCALRCTLVINEIWRLYVVFMHNWRVVVFPVGNQSSR